MNEPVMSLARLARFGRELISSTDVDPQYPMLRTLAKMRGLNEQDAHWQTVLFMAYCHFPSMMASQRRFPTPRIVDEWVNRFPTNLARRSLRGGRQIIHLNDCYNKAFVGGSVFDWATEGWTGDRIANYELFWVKSQTVWGNGRYIAFKWCEMLKKVHHLPLAAPDMRLEHCSGPKEGLCRMYGLPITTSVSVLNRYAIDLRARLEDYNLIIEDWEELETVLCEYNKHLKGRYYVGHDIDEAQGHIEDAMRSGWLKPTEAITLYEARQTCIPHEYLGERNGWVGIREKRMKEGKLK